MYCVSQLPCRYCQSHLLPSPITIMYSILYFTVFRSDGAISALFFSTRTENSFPPTVVSFMMAANNAL